MKMSLPLYDDIVNISQDCLFWKDKERRFVGVNQAFLDFYGFESADVLIGKTDEDMGWHSDPEPFKQDELRVLSGEATYKVQGKCIIRGEERDIIASKKPLYWNGEIVGLVGSFMDITDVLRRRDTNNQNKNVYTVDSLRKYSYFDKVLDEENIANVVDPLTGAISREYIIGFAQSLVFNNTPFTFVIFDLDNFKNINDGYGHYAGDYILTQVVKDVAEYVKGRGIVGRFGGDELLIINLKDTDMPSKKAFFDGIYARGDILRRNIEVDDQDIFVTATLGCATYPNDAANYEDLFTKADKTLYIGKTKGRNCYTIYDDESHKDVDMTKITKQGIFESMNIMSEIFESEVDLRDKLKMALPFLKSELRISDLYYVDIKGEVISINDNSYVANVGDVSTVIEGDIFFDNDIEGIKDSNPSFYNFLISRNIEAVMIAKVAIGKETYGYMMCAEPDTKRIWQDSECGILYFLAKQLAVGIKYEKR